MSTTAKTHLPSPDIRFRQVFDGYRVNKGDMYYLLYPAGQVIYTPSATRTRRECSVLQGGGEFAGAQEGRVWFEARSPHDGPQ